MEIPFGRYLFWVALCHQSDKPKREGVEELSLCRQFNKPEKGASVEESYPWARLWGIFLIANSWEPSLLSVEPLLGRGSWVA